MDRECLSAEARYGITFDASLITGIDPPPEVESALAAINTAHNHVSSDISLAQASADQKIVQSQRAVEIETLKAQAEVEPLNALAAQLAALKRSGPDALAIYMRNVRLRLYSQAQRVIMEVKRMIPVLIDRLRDLHSGLLRSCRSSWRSRACSACTRSSPRAPARCTCCSARSSAVLTSRGCTSCP